VHLSANHSRWESGRQQGVFTAEAGAAEIDSHLERNDAVRGLDGSLAVLVFCFNSSLVQQFAAPFLDHGESCVTLTDPLVASEKQHIVTERNEHGLIEVRQHTAHVRRFSNQTSTKNRSVLTVR
jgi:hypothetical protein